MTPATLGAGTIHRDGTGKAEFPVRGEMRLAWTKQDRENATLRVTSKLGTTECAMAWVYPNSDDLTAIAFWHGRLPVEGYEMEVRGDRNGDVLRLTFLDTIQPYTGPLAVLDENGRVVG